jgi:hypothetical protein
MYALDRMAEQAGPVVDSSGGPLGIVGRLCGLGEDELDVGVPGYGWFVVGVVVGAVGAFALHDRLRAFVKR